MPADGRYRHDIFVSYAHRDDQPVAGTVTGFVSQLVADLKTEIGRKVGKSLDIWWDHYNISGNTRVTDEIMAAASDCAGIVIVASPAYLRSEWCDKERSAFFQELRRRQGESSRAVFIVSLEPIEQAKLPGDLRDFRGYEFYRALDDGRTTRPLRSEFSSDKEIYYNRLSQLVQNVADHLERALSRPSHLGSPAGAESAAVNPSRPCVQILEVTDDLLQRRAELKDYLEQIGVTVLPEKRYSRDDMALYRQQMLGDFARSRACVQILGPLTGDRSDHPRGMAWLRADAIRESRCQTPFLQWRDPDLDLSLVTDADARELIVPASVRTDRFPDFRRAIGELALKPPPRPAPSSPQNVMSVFVNSDLLDRSFGADVANWLESHGYMVLEPPGATADAREEWETNLRYCDSLLLVYGQTKPGWVRTQILLSNKVNREAPLKVLGVCVGPPRPDPARDKVEDLALRYSGIHYVRNEDSPQPNPAEMERFVERLREIHA
jgi:hypothetical protein